MPIDAQDSFLSPDAIDHQPLMANGEPGAHLYIRYRSPKDTSDESCEIRQGDDLFAHICCGVNDTELGVAEKLSPECEHKDSLSLIIVALNHSSITTVHAFRRAMFLLTALRSHPNQPYTLKKAISPLKSQHKMMTERARSSRPGSRSLACANLILQEGSRREV